MLCDCAPLIAAPEPRLPSGRRRAGVLLAPGGVGLWRFGCGAAVPAGMPLDCDWAPLMAAPAPVLPSGLACCAIAPVATRGQANASAVRSFMAFLLFGSYANAARRAGRQASRSG